MTKREGQGPRAKQPSNRNPDPQPDKRPDRLGPEKSGCDKELKRQARHNCFVRWWPEIAILGQADEGKRRSFARQPLSRQPVFLYSPTVSLFICSKRQKRPETWRWPGKCRLLLRKSEKSAGRESSRLPTATRSMLRPDYGGSETRSAPLPPFSSSTKT